MQGRVALVTGGASGMGRIMVRRLAAKGARVAAFDLNDAGLAATCSEAPGAVPFHCDISDPEAVAGQVAEVTLQLGPTDLLVHAAALMPSHLLVEQSHDSMERLFRVNYFGTVYTVQAVLRGMLERGQGRIIAFGSIAGTALVPKMGAYCATKAAVNAYIEVLQHELRGSGVRAHLVCPPAVDTPLIEQSMTTDAAGSLAKAKQSGRLADPEKIVDAIERGVARDRDIIYPGGARMFYLWRTLAPRLWWNKMMSFEN